MTKSLSRSTPKKGGVAFQLTERDMGIIRAVGQYRYLRSGQIHRLFFSENKTVQSARRRLKLLFHNKYLERIAPFVQVGHKDQETELAYCLGLKGFALLEELGEIHTPYRKAKQVKHQYLQHAIDLSEFRLNLELAIAPLDNLEISRFTPYFEIKEARQGLYGKKRFKLYEEYIQPITGKKLVIYPDALIILSVPNTNQKRLVFVEIDRGTEGLEQIRQKLLGYHHSSINKTFCKYGDFSGFLVLFQTSSPRRVKNIVQVVSDTVCDPLVLTTDHQSVTPESVLNHPVWMEASGAFRSILK